MPIAVMERCHFSQRIEETNCKSHLVSDHGEEEDRFIEQDEFLCSLNKRYRFGLTVDENLCLCDGDRKLWCADSCCDRGDAPYAVLKDDGNLVAYSERNIAGGLRRDNKIWESKTDDKGVTKLKVYNNGDLRIYNADDESEVYWEADRESWDYTLLEPGRK